MARINGDIGGLLPPVQKSSAPKRAPRSSQPDDTFECPCCHAPQKLGASKRAKRSIERDDEKDFSLCNKCWDLYSHPVAGPVIFETWQVAQQKIAEARKHEWVICLTTMTFGSAGGNALTIELGDVYKVARAGGEHDSKAANTIDINLGGLAITLWPHEFAVLSMTQILLMVGDGEMTNAFISDNDDTGYWCPVEKIRKQIVAAFGRGRASGIGVGWPRQMPG